MPPRRALTAGITVVLLQLHYVPASRAQYLPSSPIVVAGGRVVVGGDVAGAIGGQDEEGWFNYTDYEHNALRTLRLGVTGEWRAAPRLSLLGEVRVENMEHVEVFAAYVRVRPFATLPLDVQAGRIPPTFGSFARRAYSSENWLIGYPLAYQYLVSIRPDAIPASTADLLRMRARGWRSSFPVGSNEETPGVSVVSGFEWDTGVQVRGGTDRAQLAVSITNGSLSSPRVRDDNGGKQIAARGQLRPLFGLVVGISGARGAWLDREVERLTVSGQSRATQRAYGVDAEYSRGHWIVRGEAIRSAWQMPGVLAADDARDLLATAALIEARYRVLPRLYVAARADHLTFSKVEVAPGEGWTPWEAPISRLEIGGGWYLQRNLIARASVQHNWRDGGRQREQTFLAGQVLFWF